MSLAGLLFDKDGTLVDFDRTWGRATHAVIEHLTGGDRVVIARLAESIHYVVEERRYHPDSPMIAGSTAQVLAAWGGALGRLDDPSLAGELNDRFAAESLKTLMPVGDPGAVLHALEARGLRLGLATNDTEANARIQLAALGLDAHMQFVAGYDSGHGGKPEPGMVLAFADHLGVEPSRVALVGDTTHDLHAARAAGAIGIAVLTGPAPRAMLEPLADHVIDSIADLPGLVASLA